VSALPAAITASLARLDLRDATVVALTPDASDRRYFRVSPARTDAVVLALHSAPFAPGALPFTIVGRLFEQVPLPVPRVRAEFPEIGVLVLDDLGDVTLQAHTDSAPDDRHRALYERAVDHLIALQRRGAELAMPGTLPWTRAFDVEKLMWEMTFFLTHFIEGFRGLTMSPAHRGALEAELGMLVEELAAEPRVLCHRDYHSRNLMVAGDDLYIIDFQDARLGPNTYDLVSLLRDCYVDLPPALVAHLVDRFHRAAGDGEPAEVFAARLDAMGVQRHLKALGTFGYQTVARANPAYAAYVPRTTAYLRAAFERWPRFARLRDLLVPLVPEVA